MRLASIVAWIVLATATAMAQEKSVIGEFTKSPTEHIINRIEQPFLVGSVRGTIIRKEGFREPLANVLFEIQGPGGGKKIRKATTDERGRFKIAGVLPGTYKFKATLNGFQSVMGTIVVSSEAKRRTEINLEMGTGV